MTTIADVLPTYSDDAIKAKLLGYLQAAKAGVTDWNSGAFLRSLMIQWQQALINYAGTASPNPGLREVIFSGAVPLLPATPSAVSSAWLTLVADQLFDVQRNFDLGGARFAGTFTVQALTLTCDGSHGAYPVTPGSLYVRSQMTGNRYVSNGSATIPTGSLVVVPFRAEFSNDSANGFNYADGAGTLIDLGANPLEGVTASNVAPNFSAVSSPTPPLGLGVVTVGGSTPLAPTAYDIKITLDGQVGTALFQCRTNGGPWSSNNATAATFTIPGGPTVAFANDGGGSDPSFIIGDDYYFTSPGTPITTVGIDPETDVALLDRCLARWPDLMVIPDERHRVWAKQASALVTRVHVSVDASLPGFYDVTIAGAANPLAGGVVTAVQLYINQREGIAAQSSVVAATVLTITPTGTVYAPAAKLAIIQAQAAANWNAYVNGTDIGGIVRVVKLEQFLYDAGATNVDSLLINAALSVVLTATQVAAPADIIAGLTWSST